MRLISIGCLTVGVLELILLRPVRVWANPDLVLTSSAFQNGGKIPASYTCSGLNKSPALAWTGAPGGTRSFALILSDPDAPGGTFVHWVIYNLSKATKELSEGELASITNGEEGINARGESGYTGPCPPPGKPHHYHFRLYALDQKLELGAGAGAEQVEAAMKGHVLASGELVGVFER
jgi:Raf kinase inhibitor-like YbhB/YbcL family protein